MPNDFVELSDLGKTDVLGGGPGTSTANANTGDLRRKFNFGDRVSELAIAQDPFFRFVSKASKKPTDDPTFKYTERRGSWHKRYAYVVAFDSAGSIEVHDSELDDSSIGGAVAAGGEVALYMATDYESKGNIQNVYGQSGNKVTVGGAGTRPTFFLPGQLIKVPVMNATTGTDVDGYHVVKITSVQQADLTGNMGVDNDNAECVKVTGKVVKKDAAGNELASFALNGSANTGFNTGSTNGSNESYDRDIATQLEKIRTYVIGTAHDEGSGYPQTWMDQPFSTQYGITQIWKTSCAMTNTARATSLKYDSNEWARIWKEKLIEHKYDIETALLFGSQNEDYNTTQGAIDYVLNYGNKFTLNTATKTSDDFLDDMSNYLDPRYNNASATVFFVSTAVYNWMHKLGGYFLNNANLGRVQNAAGDEYVGGSVYSSDIAIMGKKKVFGVDITTFSTPYGDMNVARNIHLDGTNIQMLGVDMKHCAYRPLVGNGVNRDTSVYVGVQTLENSGVDRRVDLILTEAGMEWSMPEAHAVWTV
tara:strand:- start:4523 stop:6121 length:1599 start_codon:yes stop_codon:yes gene_type:complete